MTGRAPAGRHSGVLARLGGRGPATVLLVGVLAGASGPSTGLDLDRYLAAAASGVTGAIAGRAFEERRRLDLPDQPLRSATVTLLPHAGGLAARLQDLKRRARDSDDAFRLAVPRMLEAQQAHEGAVQAAGGATLVFTVSTGSTGAFALRGVPAGAWILIAREDRLVPEERRELTKRDRETYRMQPPLDAYRSVRLWVREVTVVGGRVETVELTDRNVWFSGVIEERSSGGR